MIGKGVRRVLKVVGQQERRQGFFEGKMRRNFQRMHHGKREAEILGKKSLEPPQVDQTT